MYAILEVLDSIEAIVSLLLVLGMFWVMGPKVIAFILVGLVLFILTAIALSSFFGFFHTSLQPFGFFLTFPITGYFLWKIGNHPKIYPNNKGNNQKN